MYLLTFIRYILLRKYTMCDFHNFGLIFAGKCTPDFILHYFLILEQHCVRYENNYGLEFYLYDWCVIDVHILVQFVNTYILSTFVLRIEYVLVHIYVFTSTQNGILKIAKTYFSKHQNFYNFNQILLCFIFMIYFCAHSFKFISYDLNKSRH